MQVRMYVCSRMQLMPLTSVVRVVLVSTMLDLIVDLMFLNMQ